MWLIFYKKENYIHIFFCSSRAIKYLCVSGNPIGRFAVIITFLDPFSQPVTFNRIMPILAACETTRKYFCRLLSSKLHVTCTQPNCNVASTQTLRKLGGGTQQPACLLHIYKPRQNWYWAWRDNPTFERCTVIYLIPTLVETRTYQNTCPHLQVTGCES